MQGIAEYPIGRKIKWKFSDEGKHLTSADLEGLFKAKVKVSELILNTLNVQLNN